MTMPKTSEQIVLERGLPANLDAERFVLGSALLDSQLLTDCIASLKAEDFALDKHRIIFARMVALDSHGKRVDRVTLANELRRTDDLEKVDGLTYIIGLDEDIPQLPDVSSYIAIVKEKSVLRQTIEACEQLKQECLMQPESATELLARGERLISEIQGSIVEESEFHTPEEIIQRAGGPQKYFDRRRKPGVMTPYQKLNEATRGLQPGHLIILAARPSMGKSALASNIGVYASQNGTGTALFSLEMEDEEQNDRVLALAGNCTHGDLRGIDPHKIRPALAGINNLPLFISGIAHQTVPSIRSKLRKLRAKHNIGLVIVDYLQLLSGAGRFENRTQEVSSMSRGLKIIAMEEKLPMLVLSQLSRQEKGVKRRPTLSDLRESGSIEQDANEVMFIHSEEEYRTFESGAAIPIELIIEKQRNGPKLDIPMHFFANRGLFVEAA